MLIAVVVGTSTSDEQVRAELGEWPLIRVRLQPGQRIRVDVLSQEGGSEHIAARSVSTQVRPRVEANASSRLARVLERVQARVGGDPREFHVPVTAPASRPNYALVDEIDRLLDRYEATTLVVHGRRPEAVGWMLAQRRPSTVVLADLAVAASVIRATLATHPDVSLHAVRLVLDPAYRAPIATDAAVAEQSEARRRVVVLTSSTAIGDHIAQEVAASREVPRRSRCWSVCTRKGKLTRTCWARQSSFGIRSSSHATCTPGRPTSGAAWASRPSWRPRSTRSALRSRDINRESRLSRLPSGGLRSRWDGLSTQLGVLVASARAKAGSASTASAREGRVAQLLPTALRRRPAVLDDLVSGLGPRLERLRPDEIIACGAEALVVAADVAARLHSVGLACTVRYLPREGVCMGGSVPPLSPAEVVSIERERAGSIGTLSLAQCRAQQTAPNGGSPRRFWPTPDGLRARLGLNAGTPLTVYPAGVTPPSDAEPLDEDLEVADDGRVLVLSDDEVVWRSARTSLPQRTRSRTIRSEAVLRPGLDALKDDRCTVVEPVGRSTRERAFFGAGTPAASRDAVMEPTQARAILFGPANYAGQAHAWSAALRRNGLRATSLQVVDEGNPFAFDSDITVTRQDWQNRSIRHELMRSVASQHSDVVLEAGRPLFQMGATEGIPDAEQLIRSGFRTAVLLHGSEIRRPQPHARRQPWSPYAQPSNASLTRRLIAHTNLVHRQLLSFEGPVFVSTPDLLLDVPWAVWLPLTVDTELFRPRERTVDSHHAPVVMHAPSSGPIKGSSFVDPILKRLNAEGVIAYQRLHGIPHEMMPMAMAGADIVVDQLLPERYRSRSSRVDGERSCRGRATSTAQPRTPSPSVHLSCTQRLRPWKALCGDSPSTTTCARRWATRAAATRSPTTMVVDRQRCSRRTWGSASLPAID